MEDRWRFRRVGRPGEHFGEWGALFRRKGSAGRAAKNAERVDKPLRTYFCGEEKSDCLEGEALLSKWRGQEGLGGDYGRHHLLPLLRGLRAVYSVSQKCGILMEN